MAAQAAFAFTELVVRAARAVIGSGPSMPQVERMAQREGGTVPNHIIDGLASPLCPECNSDGYARVSVHSIHTGATWFGCLNCAPREISKRAFLRGWVLG